jgi:hypothetical protein
MLSAAPPPASDSIRYMHDVTGKYHTHYSIVRTTTTSLLLPIGILASTTLMINCNTTGALFPFLFLLFIITATIVLNMIFSRWSRACRHIERYYENLIDKQIPFDANIHGFRHIFGKVIRKTTRTASESALPPSLSWCRPRNWLDPFITSIAVFGLIYLIFYSVALNRTCATW